MQTFLGNFYSIWRLFTGHTEQIFYKSNRVIYLHVKERDLGSLIKAALPNFRLERAALKNSLWLVSLTLCTRRRRRGRYHPIIRRGSRKATSEQRKSINHDDKPDRFAAHHRDVVGVVKRNSLVVVVEDDEEETNFLLLFLFSLLFCLSCGARAHTQRENSIYLFSFFFNTFSSFWILFSFHFCKLLKFFFFLLFLLPISRFRDFLFHPNRHRVIKIVEVDFIS